MRSRRPSATALALGAVVAACAACAGQTESVVGRWQGVDLPKEWMQFDRDGTLTVRTYTDSVPFRARYEQHGRTVTVRSPYGNQRHLTLRDSFLVMEDGMRYRRVR